MHTLGGGLPSPHAPACVSTLHTFPPADSTNVLSPLPPWNVQRVAATKAGGEALLAREELPRLGRAASELAPLLPDLAPGLGYMTEAFTRAFIGRVFQRLAGVGPGRDSLPPFRGDSAMAALGFTATPPRPLRR